MTATRDDVVQALRGLTAPDGSPLPFSGKGGLEIAIERARVLVTIPVAGGQPAAWEPLRAEIERRVASLAGVERALVTLTAEAPPGSSAAARVTSAAPAARPRPTELGIPTRFPSLAQIKRLVAVASGKGGVGKSTTAVNVALSLRARGLKVGILDADIHGPSLPKLMNLKGRPNLVAGRTLAPLEAYGCKAMSIGLVVDAGKALVWRGPMVASAITQMLRDIAWGALDILVIDMPPGTGDAQLTLAQQAPLAGAIIVSTPQDLALIDARRGVEMFREVGVPILGLVENMSYFVCDGCGKHHHIFAHGGARAEAQKFGVPFLGEIPLDAAIRQRADSGMPIVVTEPDGPQAGAYDAVAAAVIAAVGLG